MALTQLAPPYPIFTDKSGDPLDAGYLYFGVANLNPETNLIQVYYDRGFTQPVAQPVRTSNGYIMRNGSPALIYADSQFSVTVRNKNSELVIYSPVGYGVTPGIPFAMFENAARDVAALLADTQFVYAAGVPNTVQVTPGDILRTLAEGFAYEVAASGATDQHVTTAGGVKLYVLPGASGFNVKAFGAVGGGVVDDTAAITSAPLPRVLSDGTYLVTGGVDTETLKGPGKLIVATGGNEVGEQEWKSGDFAQTRFVLEDEFAAHAVIGGQDMYYSAFGGACFVSGKEVYASRVGYQHERNAAYSSGVNLHIIDPSQQPQISKILVHTSASGVDVRDVKVTPWPAQPTKCLISFAEFDGTNYSVRLIVFDVVTATVDSNRLLSGPPADNFAWGNALIDTTGRLLITTYNLTGTQINVFRGTSTFSNTTGASLAAVKTFTDTFSSEPTMGYWKDRLVIFWRRTGAASKYAYTFDLTGQTGWSTPVFPYGTSAHAPTLLPYSQNDVMVAAFSLGTNRTKWGLLSTTDVSQDFNNVKSVLFDTPFSQIGGYTSLIDRGGSYAIAMYAESPEGTTPVLRTRVEIFTISKSAVEIGMDDNNYIPIVYSQDQPPSGSSGIWSGSPYGAKTLYTSSGTNYSFEFQVKRDMSVSSVSIITGVNSPFTVSILDASGSVLGTSNSVNPGSTDATMTVFPFASAVSLTAPNIYRLRLDGAGRVYDFRTRFNTPLRFEYDEIILRPMRNASGTVIPGSIGFLALKVLN